MPAFCISGQPATSASTYSARARDANCNSSLSVNGSITTPVNFRLHFADERLDLIDRCRLENLGKLHPQRVGAADFCYTRLALLDDLLGERSHGDPDSASLREKVRLLFGASVFRFYRALIS